MRGTHTLMAGLVAAAMLGTATPATALPTGSEFFPSTMRVGCGTPACNEVIFTLALNPEARDPVLLTELGITIAPAGGWQFGGPMVRDGSGLLLDGVAFDPSKFRIEQSGVDLFLSTNEPSLFQFRRTISLTALLENPSSPGAFFRGSFQYGGYGPHADLSGTASVAPEPASMTLLGTGLLGLIGAARRRRRARAAA